MRGARRHRTAPQESRRQPVPATHRLTPGLPRRGRRPMTNPFQTVSQNRELRTENSDIRNDCGGRKYWFNHSADRGCLSITGVTRWIFKPDVSSDESRFRLRQRGTFCFLFTKHWLSEPMFREQDLVTSALPAAKPADCPGRCLVWNRPRNSCQ